jgi:MFS family permease
MTFLAVKLNGIGTSENIVGYIHSAFYGGILIGAIKSEELINRVGHIRAFTCFSSIITIMIILQGYFQNPLSWIIFRFFSGFALAASYVIIESWLLAQATDKTKGKILSIYMLCLYLSQSLSQFFLDFVDIDSMEPFLLASILASLSIIPSSLTYMKAPEIDITNKMSILKYFKISQFGFLGCVISGLILSSIYSFLPTYAQDNNLSVSAIVGITIAGGFCLQWPIGKLSDMFDRTKVLTMLSLCTIFVSLIVLLISNEVMIYVVCFFLGGLCFTIYPISIAQVCDNLGHGNVINMTGALLCSYGMGAVLGPQILAPLIGLFGSGIIFGYIAFMALTLSALGIYTITRVKTIPNEAQVDFVVMPRATPVANNLDPRG